MNIKNYTTEELQDIIINFHKIQHEYKKRIKQNKTKITVGKVYTHKNNANMYSLVTRIEENGFFYCNNIILDEDQITNYSTDYEEGQDLKETNISKEIFEEMWQKCEKYNNEVEEMHEQLFNDLNALLNL